MWKAQNAWTRVTSYSLRDNAWYIWNSFWRDYQAGIAVQRYFFPGGTPISKGRGYLRFLSGVKNGVPPCPSPPPPRLVCLLVGLHWRLHSSIPPFLISSLPLPVNTKKKKLKHYLSDTWRLTLRRWHMSSQLSWIKDPCLQDLRSFRRSRVYYLSSYKILQQTLC